MGAGNAATMGRALGRVFKKAEDDPKKDRAIEDAKVMNQRCAVLHEGKADVDRATKALSNLKEQKEREETELAALQGGLPDRARAIQDAKIKTFTEIEAIFSGDEASGGR